MKARTRKDNNQPLGKRQPKGELQTTVRSVRCGTKIYHVTVLTKNNQLAKDRTVDQIFIDFLISDIQFLSYFSSQVGMDKWFRQHKREVEIIVPKTLSIYNYPQTCFKLYNTSDDSKYTLMINLSIGIETEIYNPKNFFESKETLIVEKCQEIEEYFWSELLKVKKVAIE